MSLFDKVEAKSQAHSDRESRREAERIELLENHPVRVLSREFFPAVERYVDKLADHYGFAVQAEKYDITSPNLFSLQVYDAVGFARQPRQTAGTRFCINVGHLLLHDDHIRWKTSRSAVLMVGEYRGIDPDQKYPTIDYYSEKDTTEEETLEWLEKTLVHRSRYWLPEKY